MTRKNKNHPPLPAATSKKHSQLDTAKKKHEALAKPSGINIYIALFIILLLTFIAYLPVLHNDFVNWDDDVYIQNATIIRTINFKQLFAHFYLGYQPLTMLVLAIEYHLFGLSAAGFHAVNLLFHLLNVILAYRVVFLISRKTEVALTASLLFGIHPMHVESVAWACELKDLLYVIFFLASYICYLKYFIKGQRKFYFYCLLLFVLSLLSKGMATSLTFVVLLTDLLLPYFTIYRHPLADKSDAPGKDRKINSRILIEKIPFIALSLIFGIVAVYGQQESGATDVYYTLFQRIIFVGYGFVMYIVKLLVPLNYSVYYPYPINSSAESMPFQYYIFIPVAIGLVALALYLLRFSKKIAFGFGFFTVTIMLVLQLFSFGSNIMSDRFSYLASLGIFYLAGEGIYRLINKNKKSVAIFLISIAVVFLTIKTYARCEVWKNSLTLWSDVISQYQHVVAAYNNRGLLLEEEGRYDEALSDFDKAMELRPHASSSYYNRGHLYMKVKRWDDALSDFNLAIKMKDDYAAYNNRGVVYVNKKNYDEALKDFNKSIEIKSNYAEAFVNRGNLLLDQNKLDAALIDFSKAIELQANSPQAYYNRARIEYTQGKRDVACMDLQQAINLKFAAADDAYRSLCH